MERGRFTPLIAVRGKTRSLQGVAQVKQHAMSRHGQGITVRPPRDFCVDQGDYIVSRERHVNWYLYPFLYDGAQHCSKSKPDGAVRSM